MQTNSQTTPADTTQQNETDKPESVAANQEENIPKTPKNKGKKKKKGQAAKNKKRKEKK
jgi:hypothetical protein